MSSSFQDIKDLAQTMLWADYFKLAHQSDLDLFYGQRPDRPPPLTDEQALYWGRKAVADIKAGKLVQHPPLEGYVKEDGHGADQS